MMVLDGDHSEGSKGKARRKHALQGRVAKRALRGKSADDQVNDAAKPLPTFGRNLARLRFAKQLTQEALAEGVEVHPRYVQKLEAGTAHPSLMVLCKIRHSLDCQWNDLLRDL